MKSVLLTALFALALQPSAHAEIAGYASGTLTDLHCVSLTAEDFTKEQVRVVSQKSNDDGMTISMLLKATWPKSTRDAWANFQVEVINWDVERGVLQIIGESDRGTVLELTIDTGSSGGAEYGGAVMKINGEVMPLRRLMCKAPMAG